VEGWQPVTARARRRRCFFDGKDTLACYIASRSDIEDVIPALTAFQMEWNKIHLLFQRWPTEQDLASIETDPKAWAQLSEILDIAPEDLDRLRTIWRGDFIPNLNLIRQSKRSMGVRLLSGSLSQYMRATHVWFENIEHAFPNITQRPIYFVSSNTHSLINLITGFTRQRQAELEQFVLCSEDTDLRAELENIHSGQVRSSQENFLYYVMKKYQNTQTGSALLPLQQADEETHGITRVAGMHSFEVEAQVIELNRLDPDAIDPRIQRDGPLDFLKHSDAIILNIDYPLGLAAFNILSKISEQSAEIRGVYIMGKSASLNAVRGDVIIPNVVQDEHSHNT
jgi:hypothetical protein